ncbi:MAG TPA: response regulator transcription factor [Candidatus Tectomicrobia bacterium]|nr:response regulator transcription factor [Candidatus Tectomicrobia bacterium]
MSIRLVIADAHPLILAGLQHLFHQEDDLHVLACCRDGEETLKAVYQHHPDVLILDFRLPGKDGWAVLRELVEKPVPVRVVLLAAALDVDEALQACRLGVSGVVLKEMADHLLIPCIRKVYAGERWIERNSISRAVDKLLRREAGEHKLAKVLTPREREMVGCVVGGLNNREIADKLGISEGTVKTHLHHIFKKLQVSSRLALLQYAYEEGLR